MTVITIDVTAKGAQTGRDRRVRLYAIADGDALAVVGSWGGNPKHPAWVHNLRADPRIHVKHGEREYEAEAREVDGDERARLWQALCDGFPLYARYQQRTERRFAIFRIEEVAGW